MLSTNNLKANRENLKKIANTVQYKAVEHLDCILDFVKFLNFIEVTGKMGGDTIVYRVYSDGKCYE